MTNSSHDVVHDDLIGQSIGNGYKLLELIAVGAYSRVYKARQDSLRRFVAVKLLDPELTLDEERIRRWQQEARLATSLSQQNIVRVFDVGFAPRPYIVMEFLDGQTLSSLLEREGALGLNAAVNILAPLCDALYAAHRKNIVHRDLKPANIIIMLDEAGATTAKVLDFGLAKALADSDHTDVTSSTRAPGTPAYMSPEQFTGRRIDCRSDIYSFGCIMHEVLAGTRVFNAQTAAEYAHKHLHESPIRIRSVRPDLNISKVVEDVVCHALAKQPAERYQSILDLKNDLMAATKGASTKRFAYRRPRWDAIASKSRRAFQQPQTKRIVLGLFLTIASVMLVVMNKLSIADAIWLRQYEQAKILVAHNDYAAAQRKLVPLLELADSYIGSTDWRTCRILVLLQKCYRTTGNTDGTKKLEERLHTLEQGDSSFYASSMQAGHLAQQGNYAAAEQLLEDCIAKQGTGRNECAIAFAQGTLGTLYLQEGKLERAHRLAKDCLALRRKFFDEDSALMVIPLYQLAEIEFQRHNYTQASDLLEEVLTHTKREYGRYNTDFVSALGRLGDIKMAQEDPPAAEKYFLEAIETYEQAPNKKDFNNIASIYGGLGNVYMSTHRYDLAEPLFLKALTERQKLFGPTHPEVCNDLTNVGLIWFYQGRHNDGLAVLAKVVKIRRSAFGEQHRLTAESKRRYEELSKAEAAGALKEKPPPVLAAPFADDRLEVGQVVTCLPNGNASDVRIGKVLSDDPFMESVRVECPAGADGKPGGVFLVGRGDIKGTKASRHNRAFNPGKAAPK